MTSLDNTWHVRTELELAAEQLVAIERFTRARRMAEEAAAAVARSREMRMDSARALEVSKRQQRALVARAHEQLRACGELLTGRAERRAVVAHRNEWFAGKVVDRLEAGGVHVVARLDNGADAVGATVAEQPDLLLVEDCLAMVPGLQVVREVAAYCPGTVIGAQAAHGDRVEALLEAGADAVFVRHVPPGDVARDLLALVTA